MLARIRSRARGVSVDAGATLVEVMVVVAMIGTLTAMAVWGIRGWAAANAFKGASQQIQSVLRTTQQRAITEGTLFCVKFHDATATPADQRNQYAVFRGACTSEVKTSGWFGTGSGQVGLTSFKDELGAPLAGVTFYPRGSASPGQVSVIRGSLTKVVHVEGMTGRVSTG